MGQTNMTRRELLELRVAEARRELDSVSAQINDPNTPPSQVPSLERQAANLQRRISEMEQELANLPEERRLAAMASPAGKPKKGASKRVKKPKAPR